MADVPIDHIVARLTDAVMSAVNGRKGAAETRKRVAATIHAESRKLVLVGFDEAVNAIAARRREV